MCHSLLSPNTSSFWLTLLCTCVLCAVSFSQSSVFSLARFGNRWWASSHAGPRGCDPGVGWSGREGKKPGRRAVPGQQHTASCAVGLQPQSLAQRGKALAIQAPLSNSFTIGPFIWRDFYWA